MYRVLVQFCGVFKVRGGPICNLRQADTMDPSSRHPLQRIREEQPQWHSFHVLPVPLHHIHMLVVVVADGSRTCPSADQPMIKIAGRQPCTTQQGILLGMGAVQRL